MNTQVWVGGTALRALVLLVSVLTLQGLALAQGASPVTLRIVPERSSLAPGETFKIAVVLDHEEGYHSWPNKEIPLGKDLDAFLHEYDLRTQVLVDPTPGLELVGVQWPQAVPGKVAD